ncbi:MAG: phospholipid-binding protein MlaC [Desulfovibrionaceae bacterium]
MRRLAVCTMVFMLLACSTLAVAADGPSATMEKAVNRVLDILKSGNYADASKREVLREQLNPIVNDAFDFNEMSWRTVGRQWRDFSDAQQQTFAGLFADLLTETYIDRIQAYSDEEVIFTGEVEGSKGNVEVHTVVKMADNDIPINYRMSDRSGTWRVYDVFVEGVSLVKNYRVQFQEILVNGSPEELLTVLGDKVAAMKKERAAK